MHRPYLLAFGLTLLLAGPTQAQVGRLNPRLKHELDSIGVEDQHYRIVLMKGMLGQTAVYDSVARAMHLAPEAVGPYLSEQMLRRDSSNIRRVAQLIRQYGSARRSSAAPPTR